MITFDEVIQQLIDTLRTADEAELVDLNIMIRDWKVQDPNVTASLYQHPCFALMMHHMEDEGRKCLK